jgi:CheY-like chemotaxis protein
LRLRVPYKLVVADGSPAVQKVVQMAFPEPDFEIHSFEDGLQVMESLGRIRPDAVLLSLSLPSKDGYEIGRYLKSREEFKKAVLVLLRNTFEPLDGDKMRDFDCDGIVQKPFDSEKLAQTVREAIDKKKVPHSFPEESLIEEIPSTGVIPLFEEEEFAPPPAPAAPDEDIEGKIRRMLQAEILMMERELEKRVKASLRAELQEWLNQEKK